MDEAAGGVRGILEANLRNHVLNAMETYKEEFYIEAGFGI